jgi:uncharacterized delta-60 repeat protein
MRKLWLLMIAGVLALASIGVGSAQARLDPTYGQGGTVQVQPPLSSPWRWQSINAVAAARDGSSYAVAERWRCESPAGMCTPAYALFRYTGEGALDLGFGGGGAAELPVAEHGSATLAVDALGRPLLAQVNSASIVIRRFTQSGSPDPSFGSGGAVTLSCACPTWGTASLAFGLGGAVTVLVSFPGLEGTQKTIRLFRLSENGILDTGFGGGTVEINLPSGKLTPFVIPSNRGALYLVGRARECCDAEPPPRYVARVSARGRIDTRFRAASRRALRRFGDLPAVIETAVVRPRGKIDLLGHRGKGKGFVLRLNPNGSLHRRFGRSGFKGLPHPVTSAALGSRGAIVAVNGGGSPHFLMRILADGSSDPDFGWRIPGTEGEFGLTVATQMDQKILVLDLGRRPCRSGCLQTPKLIRFLEGTRRNRR